MKKGSFVVRSCFVLCLVASAATVAQPASAGDLPASPVCGDVNDNGSVTSGDALLVLKKAVGQSAVLTCGNALVLSRYGHVDKLPSTSVFSAGYLLGNKVTIAKAGLITHLGVYGVEAGPNMRIALYADDAGSPAGLVVGTPLVALAVGQQEVPVVATEVAAGDYWIVAVFDQLAKIGIDYSTPSATVIYETRNAADPLPDPYGTASVYYG